MLLVLFAVALLVALCAFDSRLSLSGDNAEFIVLGRSLASGQGLSFINQPHAPPATKYPFGFPLMLAAVERLFPASINALKGLVVFFFALSIPLIYRVVCRYASQWQALLVSLLCLSSPVLLDYSHQVMSEIPFLAASFLALLLVERAVCRGGLRHLVWAVLALMAAYYIRTAGVALIVASIAYLVLRKRPESAAAVGIGAVLLALPWYLRNLGLGGGGYLRQLIRVNPYFPQDGTLTLPTLVQRILVNVKIYGLRDIPRLFLPFLYTDPLPPPGAGIWLLGMAIGAVLMSYLFVGLRRRELPAVYLAVYLGMCLLWPQIWSDVRFILPVVPLLFYAAVSGAAQLAGTLARKISPPALQGGLCLLFLAVFTSNVYGAVRLAVRPGGYPPEWQNYFEAGRWIRENTPPESVVACRKGFLMSVVSGRKTVGYLFTGDRRKVIEDLEANRADIVVVDRISSAAYLSLTPAVYAYQERFRKLHVIPNPDTYILKFLRGSP